MRISVENIKGKELNDGNIRKSIEINGKRFNMSDQLIRIFENSTELLD